MKLETNKGVAGCRVNGQRQASQADQGRLRPGTNICCLSLAIIAVGVVCSGCFVIRHEQFSKPDGPSNEVKRRRISQGCETYSRLFETPDFTLDVSVANWPSGWELQFLFNILPVYRYDYGKTEPLSVHLEFEPKSPGISIDTAKIFFIGTNHLRLAPAKVDIREAFSLTNRGVFHLAFPVDHRAYPDRDMPFQLSIEGLTVSNQTISLPTISFKPKTVTGPGFELPY